MSLFDRIRASKPRCIDSESFLRAIGESALINIAADEPGKSVYRFAMQTGLANKDIPLSVQILEDPHSFTLPNRSPALWIQITETTDFLTVTIRTSHLGETIQETISIDPFDHLFHEKFRSLKEDLDKLNFWSMVSSEVLIDEQRYRMYTSKIYVTEIAHNGKYHWLLSSQGFGGLYPLSLPHISSITAAQGRQVRLQADRKAQVIQEIKSDQVLLSRLKDAIEAAKQEIRSDQVFLSKLKDAAKDAALGSCPEVEMEALISKRMYPVEAKLQELILRQISLDEVSQ